MQLTFGRLTLLSCDLAKFFCQLYERGPASLVSRGRHPQMAGHRPHLWRPGRAAATQRPLELGLQRQPLFYSAACPGRGTPGCPKHKKIQFHLAFPK